MEATTSSDDLGAEKQQYCSVNEFMGYISSDLLSSFLEPQNYYVFWCDGDEGSTPERMKQLLQSVPWFTMTDSLLAQFWEPEVTGGRLILTAARRPFAMKTLYKGPSWYRKHCANHSIAVEEGRAFGPLGRAFLNGQLESSPDLRYYSIQEYPLRDRALSCGLRNYMALPVFDLLTSSCLGVLELVSFNSLDFPLEFIDLTRDLFKTLNLRLPHDKNQNQSAGHSEGRKQALSEIKQMFRAVVNDTPNVPLAMAWTPCQGCSGNCSFMQRAIYTCDLDWNKQYDYFDNDFLQACLVHKLQSGMGVAGRALSSAHKLCFCQSIYSFNILEYPLAHYARKAMLTISFAICLQSAHTGSDPYVLEFFLIPGNRDEWDPRFIIQFLLDKMRHQLLSFTVASGQKWGEELVIEMVRFRMDDELAYYQKSPSDRYPLQFKVWSPAEVEQISRSKNALPPPEIAGGDLGLVTPQAAGNISSIDAAAAATTGTLQGQEEETAAPAQAPRKGSSLQISYQDLESLFGLSQKKAALSLGVSQSTFKRACRIHNISRWPYHLRNKANRSLFMARLPDKPGLDAVSSGASKPSTSSTTVQLQADTKLVTARANYQSKNVKFHVCASSGIAELEEQVAKRLKLKTGDFELSYVDEDGHSISITCDEDFWFCIEALTSTGPATIQLSVTLSSSSY